MTTALLIVHLIVTLVLIAVVLVQRSEGGGLGVGTSQGMGGFMSGRGTANLLTRTTAILGTLFFVLSLALALLNRGTTVTDTRSIMDVGPTRPGAAVTPALTPNPAGSPVTAEPPPVTNAPPTAESPVVLPNNIPAQLQPPAAADPQLPSLPDTPPPSPDAAPR